MYLSNPSSTTSHSQAARKLQRRAPSAQPPHNLMDQYIPSTSSADLLPWDASDPSYLLPAPAGSPSSSLMGSTSSRNKVASTSGAASIVPSPRQSTSHEGRLATASSSPMPATSASATTTPTPRRVTQPRSPKPPSSPNSSRPSSSARTAGGPISPDTAAATKYDMKRLLSKPAPPSSSLGSSFFSSASPQADNPLSLSLASASSTSSYLRSASDAWLPEAAPNNEFPTPGKRSRQTSNASRQPVTPRTRTVTQTSSTASSSQHHFGNYTIVTESPQTSPRADETTPSRALTPASAIAYAYQHQSRSPRPSPVGSPSYQNFDVSSYEDHPSAFVSPRAVPDHPNRSAGPVLQTKQSSSGLRGLTRKVSGKFSRTRPATGGSSRRGNQLFADEPINGSLGSSPGSSSMGNSFLGAAAPFGGELSDVGGGSSSFDRGRGARRLDGPEVDYYPGRTGPPPTPSPPPPPPRRLLKSKSQNMLKISSGRSVSGPPLSPSAGIRATGLESIPPTPSSATGGGIWRLVKKFSSSTLREKSKVPSLSPIDPTAPPVPPLPPGIGDTSPRYSVGDDHDYGVVVGSRTRYGEFGERPSTIGERSSIATGKSSGKATGRSRSGTVVSSQQGHQTVPPVLMPSGPHPRSPHHVHKRSLSQSRATTTSSATASSPISSDLSSFRFFSGRRAAGGPMSVSSPRTSTSSYLPSDVAPPPLPMSKKQHHIMPPDAILAAMLEDYGDAMDGGSLDHYASSIDGAASSNYHGRRAATAPTPNPPSAEPRGGQLGPPSRRSTDRSRSREPSTSRKSSASASAKRESSPDSKSVRSVSKKASGTAHAPPSLPLRRTTDVLSSNVLSARAVAVQGDGSGTYAFPQTETLPRPSMEKRGIFHRIGRSKSEAQLGPPPPVVSSPLPLPKDGSSSPTKKKRWSISDDRRGSNGSAATPLSPTRATSFDSGPSASRPTSLSTTVAFRELTSGTALPKRTEIEKARMWDMLLEKSDRAGGTLHAKVDSSGFY